MFIFNLVTEAPVTFTAPLKDTKVPEKESVVLECEVSKPDVKPKWFKDGIEIKPDKKKGITTKTDGRKHSLTIPSAMVDDGGKYTVEFGDNKTECKLTVEGSSILSLSLLFLACSTALLFTCNILFLSINYGQEMNFYSCLFMRCDFYYLLFFHILDLSSFSSTMCSVASFP